MKNAVTQFVQSFPGFTTSYSGKAKTMFIHKHSHFLRRKPAQATMKQMVIDKFGPNIKFKVA